MTGLWVAWIALFAILEGYALASPKTGDTLSEHVWEWFAITKKGRPHGAGEISGNVRLRRFVLLAFMAWLSVHFLTGGLF
jgi:hypothetical protein